MTDRQPNEGARQIALLLIRLECTPYALDKDMGWSIGQTSKYLRFERKPDRTQSWDLYQRHGIEPSLFDEPPREPLDGEGGTGGEAA